MVGRERPLARIGRAQHAAPRGDADQPDLPVESPLQGALSVPIDQIFPDPKQPRREFDPAKLRELADSLKEHKQIQPAIVREAGTLPDGRTRYILIVGGRRRAAAELAELKTLDVIVRGSSDSTEAARAEQRAKDWLVQLAENMHREDVNPVREAEVYRAYMALTGKSAVKLAGDLGCGHTRVSNRLKLLEDRDVSDAVLDGRISYTVGNQLMRVADTARRATLLAQATAEALTEDQVRSLRARDTGDEGAAPRTPGGGAEPAPADRAARDDGHAEPGAWATGGTARGRDLSIVPRPVPASDPDDTAAAAETSQGAPAAQAPRDAEGGGTATGAPRTPPRAEFISRLYSVGPTGPLLDLLDWALAARMDLAGLRRCVATEAENLRRDNPDEGVGEA